MKDLSTAERDYSNPHNRPGFRWSRRVEDENGYKAVFYRLRYDTGKHVAGINLAFALEFPRGYAAIKLAEARRELREIVAAGPPQC